MKTIWKLLRQSLSMHWHRIWTVDCDHARQALSCYSFMDCVGGFEKNHLLKALSQSYANARSFEKSSAFGDAWNQTRKPGLMWPASQIPLGRCVLLVANSSLRALSLISDAKMKGCHLVVEDCTFSKQFVAPIHLGVASGLEFQSRHRLLTRLREIRQTEHHNPTLFVTFCDRSICGGDSVEAKVAGSKYHLSIVDALLMVAAFDDVFLLGAELRPVFVTGVDRTSGQVCGETLCRYTNLCGEALSEVIVQAPGQYLGMRQLVTRSVKYRINTERTQKALVKSLLNYCQMGEMPIPADSYRRFLLKLDAAVT